MPASPIGRACGADDADQRRLRGAIVGEATIDRLWHAVRALPTVSEVRLGALEQVRADDVTA